ncbi:MAG: tRNA pseudouridine(55) synthase TruB [Bacteroidales bacterium]|nr:tRNA pseudouridine(55) synthase TruB [Bacteroidales bacterium]
MSGKAGLIIAVDKPVGWSSFQAVNKVKWHLKREFGLKKFKIGHAGTLDPLASGLLLICVGSATKQIEGLQAGIKEYTGTLVLGATTPCYDLERAVDAVYPTAHITDAMLMAAAQQFTGPQEQVPPTFSAVKVDGKRAYVAARDGDDVQISAKHIEIYDFAITAIRHGDTTLFAQWSEANPLSDSAVDSSQRELYREPQGRVPEGLPQVDFRVTCSKGTYIRSLARDYGASLDSGAFLSALRRERIGDYRVDDALPIAGIETQIRATEPKYEMLKQL